MSSILRKLEILADSAKYDASCASSGSSVKRPGSIGGTSTCGICHSWSSDGRCISLFKILMTNICVYDCAYCINRTSNDIPRTVLTPDEIADLTIEFYKRNYIEGLFLSSGVIKNPDYTMERLILAIKTLRVARGFGGYIHVKLIPGASQDLIDRAGLYADRVSVNIELPSKESLGRLAPQKKPDAIVNPMKKVSTDILENKKERRKHKKLQPYAPAGQSTQLIVGATPESDHQILQLSEWLYKTVSLKRVYYSAYTPVNTGPLLPEIWKPPLLREHRLYQADWLMRFYGFSSDEILTSSSPMLDTEFDPKVTWALRHPERFPVEINKADYYDLLRVPGIGVRSAGKILAARRAHSLRMENLQKLRIALKRARYFITINGRYFGGSSQEPSFIRNRLSRDAASSPGIAEQLYLDLAVKTPDTETVRTAITGEL